MKKKLTAADLASPNPSEEAKKAILEALEKSCEDQEKLVKEWEKRGYIMSIGGEE